jgi:hypothetical protein
LAGLRRRAGTTGYRQPDAAGVEWLSREAKVVGNRSHRMLHTILQVAVTPNE